MSNGAIETPKSSTASAASSGSRKIAAFDKPKTRVPFLLFANRRDLARREFVDTYSFLFSCFEQRAPHIYWDEVTVVMVCKVGFVFLTVFLATTTGLTQAYTAIIFICISIVVHAWFQPYSNAVLDRLEATSLCSMFLTLYAGLFFYADFLDNTSLMTGPITSVMVAWHSLIFVLFVLVGIQLGLRQAARAHPALIEKLEARAQRSALWRYAAALARRLVGDSPAVDKSTRYSARTRWSASTEPVDELDFTTSSSASRGGPPRLTAVHGRRAHGGDGSTAGIGVASGSRR